MPPEFGPLFIGKHTMAKATVVYALDMGEDCPVYVSCCDIVKDHIFERASSLMHDLGKLFVSHDPQLRYDTIA